MSGSAYGPTPERPNPRLLVDDNEDRSFDAEPRIIKVASEQYNAMSPMTRARHDTAPGSEIYINER